MVFDFESHSNKRAKEYFPLNLLCLFGDLPLVNFIIEKRLDGRMSKNCKYGWTPIHKAAACGHTDIVKTLIANKYSTSVPSDSGRWTPIHIAAANGHVETIKALIEYTENANTRNNSGSVCNLRVRKNFGVPV